MQKSDLVRLHHMLDAAIEAISFAKSRSRKDLDEDLQFMRALVKSIEIMGEAAAKVTEQTKGELSQIPWARIVGMRNRLIHAYYDINVDVVWSTVKEDLPPLIEQLEKILPPDENQ